MMAAWSEYTINVKEQAYNALPSHSQHTSFNYTLCTSQTCPLTLGTYRYLPSIPGNAFFATLFGILLLINVPLGIYYRTWGVLVSMALGLGLEAAAYIARIMIHENDFSRNIFIIYIYCITLGATFLSAAIYLCLSRIVVAYGEQYARLKPRTYSILFMTGDFIALSLQGAGGGMVQVAAVQDVGLDVLVAGLGFQILSLALFAVACADFAWCLHHHKGTRNTRFIELIASGKWTGFLIALAIGTIGITVRSAYRVAELQSGFHSHLFNEEVLFMILEGTVMSGVSIALTAFHPGLVFGEKWAYANFSLRKA